jgi:hypothetical protein
MRTSGDNVLVTHHESHHPNEPATGRCTCRSEHWSRQDSPSDAVRITCLAYGNHWWDLRGNEVDGPPLTPYTAILVGIDPAKYRLIDATRRAGQRPHPPRADRFKWWHDPLLNLLCDLALNPECLPLVLRRLAGYIAGRCTGFCSNKAT